MQDKNELTSHLDTEFINGILLIFVQYAKPNVSTRVILVTLFILLS